MPTTATRAVLRPSRLLLRRAHPRNASTTSDAANKAKDTASQATSKTKEVAAQAVSKTRETASQAQSKASEGLTRVSSSASSAVSRTGSAVQNMLNRIGGRTGRLISTVQSLIPPTIYYSRVGLELARMVFREQKMSPPSMAQFQSSFQPLVNAMRNPASLTSANPGILNPQHLLNQMRNMTTQQMVGLGVIAAELVGFFTVGEIIGKLKIVGYRSNQALHEGH